MKVDQVMQTNLYYCLREGVLITESVNRP